MKWLAGFLLAGMCSLIACNRDPRLALDYKLEGSLDTASISRIETRVDVDATDPRRFTADVPFRTVEVGVGYEVRDFDGTGTRTLLITHDASLGYAFSTAFTFTLLPPVGDAPPLQISARAVGSTSNDILAQTQTIGGTFGSDNSLVLELSDLRCGTRTCDGDTSCCGSACVNTANDPKHCGGCDTDCGARGDSCSGGTCRCNGGSACAVGSACCPGLGCVDTKSDPYSCGACGKACAAGEACNQGVCGCGGTTCGSGQVCCDGTCTAGGCSCGGSTCTGSAPLCCGLSCTDVATNHDNCGACGKPCAADYKCLGGHCLCHGISVCSSGDACCSSGCAHFSDDPRNCGACGHACGAGETCAGGVCKCGTGTECTGAKLCCADSTSLRKCVSDSTDENNCGGCGITCAATEQCQGGKCVCPGTTQHCGPTETCCQGVGCFELSTSSDHCGSCEKVCPLGQSCVAGQCQMPTTKCTPTCGNNTMCIGSDCICNGVKTRCDSAGQLCCPSVLNGCADTQNDPNNCGGCGKTCDFSQPLCCNGNCVKNDEKNCGSCEKPCPSPGQCCAQPIVGGPGQNQYKCTFADGGAQALCASF